MLDLSAEDRRIREAAFALIIRRPVPIEAADLARASGVSAAALPSALDRLAQLGRIDRDPEGRVTGSAGLSLTVGPHRLRLGSTTYRTWCAYDALGIAGAMQADATISTACAVCDRPIDVVITAGQPASGRPERLWLADDGPDLRTDVCAPTVLLCSAGHGAAWAWERGPTGRQVSLAEGAAMGAREWASCAAAVAASLGD
jgi:hypothetical protein